MGGRPLKKHRFATRAVHGGKRNVRPVHSHTVPIFQTVNYEYEDFNQKLRVSSGEEEGYLYTRYSNPTVDAMNEAVADVEEADKAFAFASGMAAISTAFFALIKDGDHVLASSVLYGGSYDFLVNFLPQYGVEASFVDVWDHDAVKKGFRKNTRVLYLEPMMNPTLMLADLPALASFAKEHDVFVLVDNTFTPPYLFHPFRNGAQGVVHSTTKFIGGHGDTIGGIVLGSDPFMEKVEKLGRVYGGVMSPFNAWLTLRGLRTLGVRLERSCENALALAEFLEGHAKVRRVYYPGLESHPQHTLAKALFAGFGSMVSFEIDGGLNAARKADDAFRLITSTVSLGEVDTIASHPASSSHRNMSPEYRDKYGITDGLIRLSVGIEDIEDLKADIEQALNSL